MPRTFTRFGLFSFVALLVLSMAPRGGTVAVDDDVHIQGNYLEWMFAPGDGGALNTLLIRGGKDNLAGENGLLQEGFGVGSYYLPNRRLNEQLEIVDPNSNRPMLRYSYDCDGPNIKGLRVTRLMEPLPDETSMRITWTIENTGDETQWISPWVRNDVRASAANKMLLPTLDGMTDITREAFYPASRNWAVVTETNRNESVCAIFHADHTHAFLALCDELGKPYGAQTAFVPRLLKPREMWTTMYRLNVVRGLERVDFADDAVAAQINYEDNAFSVVLAATKAMENVQIEARIVAENKRVWRLSRKRFDLSPTRLARCTWKWQPPADGVYELMAQLYEGDAVIELGKDTASPHGGIDTFFTVGNPPARHMEAWTDAPHALDRGARESRATAAITGPTTLWFASSLEKVFREDSIIPSGIPEPTARIALAKNEYESFQICMRPPDDESLFNVRVTVEDLVERGGGARIPAADIAVHNVRYHDVRVPSHYEGPTGWFPDALPAHQPFTAEAGATTPVWITVYARPELPPGIYRGPITLSAADNDPWELWIEAQVFNFTLPATPALKTDFGFSTTRLAEQARRLGLNLDAVAPQYLQAALTHRITLRDFCRLPRESADYEGDLDRFMTRLNGLNNAGATTFYVPETLINTPAQLEMANAFVRRQGLRQRAFTQLAYEPEEPAWNRVLERMQQWKDVAPDIPIVISTMGLRPFIPDLLDIWSVHAQVLDTTHNISVLERAAAGGEVWWYVNHAPPRPYGNLFVDFAAIEHRILFWQSWALGMRGMQYWSVNNWPTTGDPFENLLDITPVNGDGILVYPGRNGPVVSIRWEVIRDGLEDYDYLALFMERTRALMEQGGHEALLRRAAGVYNLEEIVPSLVTFTRDPEALLRKRREIAAMIEEMDRAL
mgnify:CR=1 FL=1